MKTFTYTARDSSGALQRGALGAVDRSAALDAIRRKGLTPVSVIESGVGRDASPRRPSPRALAYASAVLVVLAAGGVWRAFSRRDGRLGEASLPEAAERRLPPAAPVRPPVSDSSDLSDPPPAALGDAHPPVPAAPAPAVTPAPVAPQRKPGGQSERKVMRIDAMLDLATNTPSGYSSGTEKVINMIVNARPGGMPPPLLKLPRGENIADILSRDILVYDEDSEKTVAEKENVAYAKELLKEYINDGGNADDFLEYYHKTLSDAFNERQASQKFTMDLMRAGDKEGAEKYLAEKNKELEAKGIMPIRLPGFMR